VKILFAVPRSYNPKQMYREYPLGVGYLGTILKQKGHEVSIFDQNAEEATDAQFHQSVTRFQPDVIGFSVITPNYPVARKQIHALKLAFPEVPIIAGGIHASMFPEDLLSDGADAVVLGEGELVISELVDCLTSGREPEKVGGVVYKNLAGAVVRTAGWSQTSALDELPFVDRSLYNLPRYTHHSILASRGCPHHCAFCCNYTGTIRNDGVSIRWHEKVVDEMQHLRDNYGAREIFFADDIFLLRKSDITQFCRSCAGRNLGLRWIGQMRADRVDMAIATAMRQAGCQRIYFGVESGSEAVLKRAQKGMTKDQIRRGIRAAIDSGLRAKTGWIYGLPGSLEEQYESIDFMLELRPHEISIHQLIPFPGTVYYKEPERFGIRIPNPKSFESFCYGGLDGEIRFDYLSHEQLVKLLEDTGRALEAEGYVNSDRADAGAEFIYTTPLSRNSMNVFRPLSHAVAA
jgi:anaerobic magnesium-protoporphyrin IX monomethyl ester cyclase